MYESRHPLCAVFIFIHVLFALALFVLNVGMNVILSIFMVETELLISFDKLMKKIALFLFIKELKYLRITILNYLLGRK